MDSTQDPTPTSPQNRDPEKQKAEMVMLRGLGYAQREIADKMSVSQGQVSYHLREVNEKARQKGDVSTFTSILVDGFLPEILEKMRLLEGLR